ncbi:hypothetical protein [Gulosibacter sp. 10]|uniref:hypothetical protein n=1 Tax=Gulosibacter sp. 10 TaxID=1255570 RepID=UPI00159535B0|nr:hypothetical protein [Gulosibacter sp. 10]
MDERVRHSGRGPRMLARGWALAVVATAPAAALHGAAHGHDPEPAVLLVAVVLAAAISVPLIGRRFSRLRSALAILSSQALFHAFFTATDLSGVSAPGVDTHAHHFETGALHLVAPAAEAAGGWMLGAHLLAALATVGLVWYGEALLRRILRGCHAAVDRLVRLVRTAGPRPIPAARPRTGFGTLIRPLSARTAEAIRRRGPPALA